MDELEKLATFIEAALRHADLPDNPGIVSVGRVESRDEARVLGVELASGTGLFIEIELA